MNGDERLRRVRLGDLQKVVRSRCGYVLPDGDDGREYLFELLLTISLGDGADRKMHHAVDLWAPWMDADERLELFDRVNSTPASLRKSKARPLGERLRLIDGERSALGVRTIAAVDVTDAQMKRRRKAKRLAYEERRRRKAGKKPRSAYLVAVASAQPWLRLGIHKRKYYRLKKAGTLPEPVSQGERPIKLSTSVVLPSDTVCAESPQERSGLSRNQIKAEGRQKAHVCERLPSAPKRAV